MMKEMIKKSLGFWNNYWGSSIFPYLGNCTSLSVDF